MNNDENDMQSGNTFALNASKLGLRGDLARCIKFTGCKDITTFLFCIPRSEATGFFASHPTQTLMNTNDLGASVETAAVIKRCRLIEQLNLVVFSLEFEY